MDHDILIYVVIIVAFIVGYMVVSFIIKHLKKLKDLPPYHKEEWKTENGEANFIKPSEAHDREEMEKREV